jgi:hypothetical protein
MCIAKSVRKHQDILNINQKNIQNYNTMMNDVEDYLWSHPLRIQRFRRRPIRWWFDLWTRNRNQAALVTVDPDIVEYNYTRAFHPTHLEEWIQVFQNDEAINLFDPELYDNSSEPFNWKQFIWHENVLHRIETHHSCQWFLNPIGEELPYHFIFQAVASFAEGRFYFIHLYSQQLHYLWGAVFALLQLDYNPNIFESIGLELNNQNTRERWRLDREASRIWFTSRQGHQGIHLSCFQFSGHTTDEIIRAVGNGSSFIFNDCLFDDGKLHFDRNYLLMIVRSNQLPVSLLYRILLTNVDRLI